MLAVESISALGNENHKSRAENPSQSPRWPIKGEARRVRALHAALRPFKRRAEAPHALIRP